MEYNNFKEELLYKMKKIDVELTEKQVKQFYNYMNLLIEWNNNINLTAITEPKEIILKHFVDCATINKFVDKNKVISCILSPICMITLLLISTAFLVKGTYNPFIYFNF